MDEVENQGSQQEIVGTEQEIAQQEIAAPETESSQDLQAQDKPKQDKSWVNRLRKERDEAIRSAKMYEEMTHRMMAQAPVQAPQVVEEDILQEIAKEDYVPGEKVAKALKKQQAEHKQQMEEMKKMFQQKQYSDSISDLKREYPDLEDVVNPDTLQIVKEKNPRLAQAWQGLDDYSIYVQAYPYIKNMGILEEVPGINRAKEVDRKIAQNKKTVQSPQAYEKRPMAQAFNIDKLTKSQLDDLNKEMHQYARQAGGY